MELKLTKHLQKFSRTRRSNCTFMELKFYYVVRSAEQKKGSNCTFMELKSIGDYTKGKRNVVLIVPLWN